LKQSQKRRGRRVVVGTSVVISGMSAFKGSFLPGRNSSADVLHAWMERGSFVWLVTAEILVEYKEVARRLGVRSHVAGRLINLLREEAEEVALGEIIEISPDPGDNCFCGCVEEGRADFLVTLNPRDFPQMKLRAEVVSPREFLKLIDLRR
jgi:predicted nucleic acid-binding protein